MKILGKRDKKIKPRPFSLELRKSELSDYDKGLRVEMLDIFMWGAPQPPIPNPDIAIRIYEKIPTGEIPVLLRAGI